MTNMTLAIPDELHRLMRKHKEVRWSEVAREALWDKVRKLELMDEILSKSKLTEKDSIKIGRMINKGISKRHNV